MKQVLLRSACLALLAIPFSITALNAQKAKGNGKVTVTKRIVKPFSSVSLDGVFTVVFIQSNESTIKVETDENLQSMVSVRQKGDEVEIMTKQEFNNGKSTKMNIFVYCNDLRKMDLAVVGNVSCNNTLVFKELKIDNSGVGKVAMKLKGDYLRADVSGVGNTYLEGEVREVQLDVASVGHFNAADLKADIVHIDYSAVGNADIFAQKAFYIDAAGIGNLTYYGPGEIKSMDKSSIGKVRHGD